jgi:hypothetical protein
VELAQSYLKGYAATWWRIMRQEEGKNHGYIWEFFKEHVTTLALDLQPRLRGLQGCRPRGRKPGSQGKGIAKVRAKRKPES